MACDEWSKTPFRCIEPQLAPAQKRDWNAPTPISIAINNSKPRCHDMSSFVCWVCMLMVCWRRFSIGRRDVELWPTARLQDATRSKIKLDLRTRLGLPWELSSPQFTGQPYGQPSLVLLGNQARSAPKAPNTPYKASTLPSRLRLSRPIPSKTWGTDPPRFFPS